MGSEGGMPKKEDGRGKSKGKKKRSQEITIISQHNERFREKKRGPKEPRNSFPQTTGAIRLHKSGRGAVPTERKENTKRNCARQNRKGKTKARPVLRELQEAGAKNVVGEDTQDTTDRWRRWPLKGKNSPPPPPPPLDPLMLNKRSQKEKEKNGTRATRWCIVNKLIEQRKQMQGKTEKFKKIVKQSNEKGGGGRRTKFWGGKRAYNVTGKPQ